MINLNSIQSEERKAVFNDGKAGVAKGVTITIKAKADGDPDNYPAYRVIYKDQNGGEVNEGYFYTDEKVDSEGNPVGIYKFAIEHLVNLCRGVFGENYTFPEYKSFKDFVDDTMRKLYKEVRGKKYQVLVAYGTTKRPESYLRVVFFGSFILPENSTKSLSLSNSALTERPAMDRDDSPVTEEDMKSSEEEDDLPF